MDIYCHNKVNAYVLQVHYILFYSPVKQLSDNFILYLSPAHLILLP